MPKVVTKKNRPKLSCDTETTGKDLRHGCSPFFITSCNEAREISYWETSVNPLTRKPEWTQEELAEVQAYLNQDAEWVFQNQKFDIRALETLGLVDNWNWAKTWDTLIAGHLLASNQPHDLTTMSLIYLGINIKPLEDSLKEAVNAARRMARSKFPTWRIAKEGLPEIPSCKSESADKAADGTPRSTPWANDMWLPRAFVKQAIHFLEFGILPPDSRQPTVHKVGTSRGVLIDRKTKWGNPFILGKHGDRPTVIRKYAEYIWNNKELQQSLPELYGQKLLCHCKPEACHGDVLRALCHPWFTVLRDYSNADSEVTLKLFAVMEEELKLRGLWKIYLERLKILPVIYEMEKTGVTLSKSRLEEKRKEYSEMLVEAKAVCLNLAASYGYELTLPKGATNNSLYNFVFTEAGMNLKSNNFTETGKYKFDKFAVDEFLLTLPEKSKPYKFIQRLKDSRSCSTALSYMESYEKYWTGEDPEWKTLYPSVNPTGTDTLRMGSSGPNEQQISKKEGFNLRYLFGPLPGWEWWSLDYENLELRIPAYESDEKAMIELFERPNDPPYFGSNHLLFAHLIHDETCVCTGCAATKAGLFNECRDIDAFKKAHINDKFDVAVYRNLRDMEADINGKIFKGLYPSWYGWTKAGDFAVQYSAVATSGTADKAYHVAGAQLRIEKKLGNIAVLNERQKDLANQYGYVETIPDIEVDPTRGYPLLCSRSKYGKVKPTLPLSYHVQGTACWIMMRAMIKAAKYLKSLKDGSRIIMNVHDEIVVAMPKKANKGNLPRVEKLKEIMAQAGTCVGIPLTVGASYCPNNWAEAV